MGTLGNPLSLGRIVGRRDTTLTIPPEARDKHLYICGATGVGKSKFLEHLIRQDIANWRKSKCGLLLLDPHGSLYDSVMSWLATHNVDRPIIPIDLRQDDWIVSYNLLRKRRVADPAVIVDAVVLAMAHVWGQEGTDKTPLFARWASNILQALYEKEFTLVEAVHLIDDPLLRYAMTANLTDRMSRRDWRMADKLKSREFEEQVSSTVSRFQRFLRNEIMRATLGQPQVSLDLGSALEDGAIVLVNLATERARVSKENAELFATLLLTDLWTAAQERGKRKNIKPFYVYLDEFQRFVTPAIADSLDEARGFGLHLTLAHQYPNQLLDRGPYGQKLYNSVMENASSKVVFRLSHESNLRPMAEWLFTGVMDPDQIKHELYSTKVMEYREEYRTAYSRSSSTGKGVGTFHGESSGEGSGMVIHDGIEDAAIESFQTSVTQASGKSESWSESETESESQVPALIPILGKELSHVQFRSLDEQLFRAMAVLFDQQQRQCVARLVGMKAPVSLFTPTMTEAAAKPDRIRRYTGKLLEKLPFALRMPEATKRLAEREKHITGEFARLTAEADEPATAKRRIR